MILSAMLTEMRYELQDSGSAIWSDAELTRGVTKSVALMSRLIPKKAIVEQVITLDVKDEALTIASSTGTLANAPVKYGTVKITGETEGHDDDFTVNHLTGVITEVGSNLADGAYTVSYTIDPYMLDISSLLSDYIKIERVEYPVGDTPPTFIVPSDIYGTYLMLKEALTEDKHIRIHYLTYWTAPGAAAGDYPRSLDNAIIIGSVGQALIYKAELYMQNSVTEIALANAAADSMATPLADINTALDSVNTIYTDVNTALDKVATYLETNEIAVDADDANAVAIMEEITAQVVSIRTAMITAITAANAHLDEVDTTDLADATDGAEKMISTGHPLINASNVGQNVGENYKDYALADVAIANVRVQTAMGYLQEFESRLKNLQAYIQESGGWVTIANTFIAEAIQRIGAMRAYVEEASQRVAEVNAWGIQADRYIATSTQYQAIAGRYLASGQAKINEMLVTLGLKAEYNMYRGSSEQFD